MDCCLRVVPEAPIEAKPLLRWAGGKRWFAKEYGDDLFDHVIERGGRFIEPFVGGAAMALHFGLDGMVLGDAEEDIAILYATVRDEPEALSVMLGLIAGFGTTKESYYHVRETEPLTSIERAAKVLYLNRLCFNGLYRKNKSGGFNVPYGGKEKLLHTRKEIDSVSRALSGAEIHHADFAKLIEKAGPHDTLYVDPPYDTDTSGAGHTDYTAKGFGSDDQERLAGCLRKAHERGAHFFAHNADTPRIRNLYSWANIIPMPERRAINRDGGGRGEVSCVLIVGS
jgi:DNA adenine methylase